MHDIALAICLALLPLAAFWMPSLALAMALGALAFALASAIAILAN